MRKNYRVLKARASQTVNRQPFTIETVWMYGEPFTFVVRRGKGAKLRLSAPRAKVES